MNRGLAERQRQAWEDAADAWDRHAPTVTEGEAAQVINLLEVGSQSRIVDLGCGNGRWARVLAGCGAKVTGVDGTRSLIDRARHANGPTDDIEYLHVDLTDASSLQVLPSAAFDGALATTVLMNLADLEPVASAAARILRPGAPLVVREVHPCFPSLWQPVGEAGGSATRANRPMARLTRLWLRVTARYPVVERALQLPLKGYLAVGLARRSATFRYLAPAVLEQAVPGQASPHLRWHRPLQDLFAPFLRAGFVLDALIEPELPAGSQRTNFLVVRLRNGA